MDASIHRRSIHAHHRFPPCLDAPSYATARQALAMSSLRTNHHEERYTRGYAYANRHGIGHVLYVPSATHVLRYHGPYRDSEDPNDPPQTAGEPERQPRRTARARWRCNWGTLGAAGTFHEESAQIYRSTGGATWVETDEYIPLDQTPKCMFRGHFHTEI